MSFASEKSNFRPLAIKLLRSLGNPRPASPHIRLLESILDKTFVRSSFIFDKRLSMQEAHCLYLTAIGKTATESAEILNVKATTINTHREKIKSKLNCTNMSEAVFEGIRLGLFTQRISKNPS